MERYLLSKKRIKIYSIILIICMIVQFIGLDNFRVKAKEETDAIAIDITINVDYSGEKEHIITSANQYQITGINDNLLKEELFLQLLSMKDYVVFSSENVTGGTKVVKISKLDNNTGVNDPDEDVDSQTYQFDYTTKGKLYKCTTHFVLVPKKVNLKNIKIKEKKFDGNKRASLDISNEDNQKGYTLEGIISKDISTQAEFDIEFEDKYPGKNKKVNVSNVLIKDENGEVSSNYELDSVENTIGNISEDNIDEYITSTNFQTDNAVKIKDEATTATYYIKDTLLSVHVNNSVTINDIKLAFVDDDKDDVEWISYSQKRIINSNDKMYEFDIDDEVQGYVVIKVIDNSGERIMFAKNWNNTPKTYDKTYFIANVPNKVTIEQLKYENGYLVGDEEVVCVSQTDNVNIKFKVTGSVAPISLVQYAVRDSEDGVITQYINVKCDENTGIYDIPIDTGNSHAKVLYLKVRIIDVLNNVYEVENDICKQYIFEDTGKPEINSIDFESKALSDIQIEKDDEYEYIIPTEYLPSFRVEVDDDSKKVKSIGYYISDSELNGGQIEAIAYDSWTKSNGVIGINLINIDFSINGYVYFRVEDIVGNVSYRRLGRVYYNIDSISNNCLIEVKYNSDTENDEKFDSDKDHNIIIGPYNKKKIEMTYIIKDAPKCGVDKYIFTIDGIEYMSDFENGYIIDNQWNVKIEKNANNRVAFTLEGNDDADCFDKNISMRYVAKDKSESGNINVKIELVNSIEDVSVETQERKWTNNSDKVYFVLPTLKCQHQEISNINVRISNNGKEYNATVYKENDTNRCYIYVKEGINAVTFVIQDNAGNISNKVTKHFYYDCTSPTISKIKISGSTKNGWYTSIPTIDLNQKKATSNESLLIYTYDILKDGKLFKNNVKDLSSIQEEGKYEIVYYLKDEAGNVAKDSGKCSSIINIDTSKPIIKTIKIDKQKAHKNIVGNIQYYDNDVILKIESMELVSGVEKYVITVGASNEIVYADNNNAVYDLNNNFVGKIGASAYDYAGNVSSKISMGDTLIVIDKSTPKKPTVKAINSQNKNVTSGNWQNGKIEFTITPSKAKCTSGIKCIQYSTDGKVWKNLTSQVSEATRANGIKTVTSAKLTVSNDIDTIYYFRTISNAGKISESTSFVTKIDNKAPSNITIRKSSTNGEIVNEHVSGINYSFFNDKVTMTVSASDSGSGIKKFTYKMGDKEYSVLSNSMDGTDNYYYANILVEKAYAGCIMISATDNVDNKSKTIKTYLAYDSHEPAAPIVLATDSNGIRVQDDVWVSSPVNIKVYGANNGTDTNNITGIQQYMYRKKGTTQWQKLTTISSTNNYRDNIYNANAANILMFEDQEETYEFAVLTNTATGMKLVNSITEFKLNIDTVKPVVNAQLINNNNTDNEYSNKDKIVRIEVTELNFRSKDVEIIVTKDGNTYNGYDMSTWVKNGNTYLSDLTLSQTGEYTVTISYTDLAGNKSQKVNINSFAIDKTNPNVIVTYNDNNTNNCYNSSRTAKIEIDEHNFDAGKVTLTATYIDSNGQLNTLNNALNWINNGDIHTATITFDKDGVYSFSISCVDKADNESNRIENQSFIIDRTAPKLEYESSVIKSKGSSYDQNVDLIIKAYDENILAKDVSFMMNITDVNGSKKDVIPDTAYTVDGDKITFDFGTMEEDGVYYIKYVATDKAGNSSNDDLIFVINKNGVSEETINFDDSQVNENGYVSKDIIPQIAIKDLSDIVSVTANLNGEMLSESDYTFDKDTKQFKLNPIINSSGTYKLDVIVTDAAGHQKTINYPEFMVDVDNPEITIGGVSDGSKISSREPVKVSFTTLLEEDKITDIFVKKNGQKEQKLNENDIEFSNNKNMATVSFDNPGEYMVYAKAIDPAGNVGTMDAISFEIDDNDTTIVEDNKKVIIIVVVALALVITGAVVVIGAKRKRKTNR